MTQFHLFAVDNMDIENKNVTFIACKYLLTESYKNLMIFTKRLSVAKVS